MILSKSLKDETDGCRRLKNITNPESKRKIIGKLFIELFEITISGSTAAIPSSVSIEGESDPNAIPFAIALGG